MTAFGDDRLPERFWAKVVVEPSGCWVWTAAHNGSGYGLTHANGRLRLAHRWAYHVLVEPLDWSAPRGTATEHVHHLCNRPACVNPAHLKKLDATDHLGHGHRDKTHCPQGHAYDEANTRVRAGGWRSCRTCDRKRQRKRRAAL